MDVITREQFDAATEQMYREASAAETRSDLLAAQVAYAELLRRRLFGIREKEGSN